MLLSPATSIYELNFLYPLPKMAQTIESNTNSSDGSEDELIKELLDNESPLFLLPKSMESEPSISIGSVMNQLLSTIYSGPTIEDIKNALPTPYQHTKSEEHKTCRSTSLMSEKGLISKMQNKYSLKIKSGENTVAEDGYKWRKYGQKSIKNNPNPRSYYKCTDPRCSAKKQVERSTEDPDTLVVTYEGLHLHFTYSHFLPTINNIKRPRTHPPPKEAQPQETQKVDPTLQSPTMIMPQQGPPGEVASPSSNSTTPQGLLEDAMQLILRKPLDNHTPSGEPSSPRSSSSSSISW